MDAKRFAIGTVVGGVTMFLVGYLFCCTACAVEYNLVFYFLLLTISFLYAHIPCR